MSEGVRRSNRTKILEEFGAFLNDESSDGHRLAQFLQEKQGNRRRLGRVFTEIEPRFSFDLRFGKLPTPPVTEPEEVDADVTIQNKSIANISEIIAPGIENAGEGENQSDMANKTPTKNIPNIPTQENTSLPLPILSPLAVPLISSPVRSMTRPNSVPPQSPQPQPQSPKRLSARRSSADGLRRYSLKRLSTLGIGRRMLLQEFDSSANNTPEFIPNGFSTPFTTKKTISFNEKDDNTSAQQSSQINDKLNAFVEKVVEKTLSKIDEQSNRNNTPTQATPTRPQTPKTPQSNLRRTYTIENSKTSQQTPKLETTKIRVVSNKTLFGSPEVMQIMGKLHNEKDSFTNLSKVKQNGEVHWTSNCAEVNNENQTLADITIPETQEQNISKETHALVNSLQQMKTPVVVVNQTFGTIPATAQQNVNATTNVLDKTVANTTQTQKEAEQRTEQQEPIIEPQLNKTIANKTQAVVINETVTNDIQTDKTKENLTENITKRNQTILTDDGSLITDDEDPVLKKVFITSGAPLNLVSNLKKTQVEKINKLSTRNFRRKRRVVNDSYETDDDRNYVGPPRAHVLNMQYKNSIKQSQKRKIINNKAPNTPINGEKFAVELKNHLQRLTNHEILDLRKRNSLGMIFKNNHIDELKSKQTRLDQEIELEMRKRNLTADIEGSQLENLTQTCIPAPIEFQNTNDLATKHTREEILYAEDGVEPMSETGSTLQSARYQDQVSFRPINKRLSTTLGKRRPKRMTPEIVRRYTNARNVLKKHSINESKRTLYSKGLSDIENEILDSYTVPSPPPAFSGDIQENNLHIVSPPPPMDLQKTPTTTQTKKSLSLSRQTRTNSRQKKEQSIHQNITTSNNNDETNTKPSSSTETNVEQTIEKPLKEKSNKKANNKITEPVVRSSTDLSSSKLSKRARKSNDESNDRSYVSCSSEPIDIAEIYAPPPIDFIDNLIAESLQDNQQTQNKSKEDDVFKKPLLPAKRKYKKKEKKTAENQNETRMSTSQTSVSDENSSSLRRSKRTHQIGNKRNEFFMSLYMQSTMKSLKEIEKRLLKKSISEKEMSPIASSTINQKSSTGKKRGRKKKIQVESTAEEDEQPQIAARKTLPTIVENLTNENSNYEEEEPPPKQQKKIRKTKKAENYEEEEAPKQQKKMRKTKTAENYEDETPKQQKKTEKKEKKTKKAETAEKTKKPEKKKNPKDVRKEVNTRLDFSHIDLAEVPVEQINQMMDQLRDETISEANGIENANTTNKESKKKNKNKKEDQVVDSTQKKKKLRVRLQRLPTDELTNSANKNSTTVSSATSDDNITAAGTSKNHNEQLDKNSASSVERGDELLSWLKTLSHNETENDFTGNNIFKEMFCSGRGRLTFYDLDGVDYAFYESETNCPNIGYLRFKPYQQRAPKTAKKYELQFIVISSSFKIGTKNEMGTFNSGDMVCIHKGQRYSIDNLKGEVGILLIIKK